MDSNSPHFTLVFMDIQMPNMDGIESTKRIRELGFSAPVVALTAFVDESNREVCMKAGMNAFLGKPIKRPLLKQVLEEFAEPIFKKIERK
jgi:osomolarity two-component system, sensor histidine kinase SLN1